VQQVAKVSDASTVIAPEIRQSRLDLAKKIGAADVLVNTKKKKISSNALWS
jgi:threonine dehydrogenase-like Zn-dependent dehydrogenase